MFVASIGHQRRSISRNRGQAQKRERERKERERYQQYKEPSRNYLVSFLLQRYLTLILWS